MQPLDRNNEAARRSAAVMRAAALHQRAESDAQCRRLRLMRVASDEMQARLRLRETNRALRRRARLDCVPGT
jgi:hypothetical protein